MGFQGGRTWNLTLASSSDVQFASYLLLNGRKLRSVGSVVTESEGKIPSGQGFVSLQQPTSGKTLFSFFKVLLIKRLHRCVGFCFMTIGMLSPSLSCVNVVPCDLALFFHCVVAFLLL